MRQKKSKLHCEELTEKAKEWFYNRRDWQVEEDIVNLYMKEFKIKDKDVRW